jgi:hypothetical protein
MSLQRRAQHFARIRAFLSAFLYERNKLQLLYIDFFNSARDKQEIEKEIDYIRENREVIELMFKAMSADSVHEYRMLTDAAYLVANLKIDVNKCPECRSRDVISYNWRQICNKCGVVIDNGYEPDYKKYNCYKRITYVKQLIKRKLADLSYYTKQRIVREACNILRQVDSHFSYSYMFRFILKKLKLYQYVDRFKLIKNPDMLDEFDEFYQKYIN